MIVHGASLDVGFEYMYLVMFPPSLTPSYLFLHHTHAECGFDEFVCDNDHCLGNYLRCDGIPDCDDRSDEDGCCK